MLPKGFDREILPMLAPRLARLVERAVPQLPAPLEEIRLREQRPLQLVFNGGDCFITAEASLVTDPARAAVATHDDLVRTFQLMAKGSVYAWEEEVRSGFLTLEGGHRVGLCGRAVVEDGRIRTL